jgi:hypothetical protein
MLAGAEAGMLWHDLYPMTCGSVWLRRFAAGKVRWSRKMGQGVKVYSTE